MDEKLWKVLENINSWLRFAENKNAYILAFIGAQISLINFLNVQIDIWLGISFSFLGLCFLVCMISFFPKTIILGWVWRVYCFVKSHQQPADDDNLLFYVHIAKYTTKQYINKMSKYLNVQIEGNKYLEDLCDQIVINAGITDTKFNIFKISFWLMLLGQLFFVISLIR